MYSVLPSTVSQSKDLGVPTVPTQRSRFLSLFLELTVPAVRHSEGLLHTAKDASLTLDNTISKEFRIKKRKEASRKAGVDVKPKLSAVNLRPGEKRHKTLRTKQRKELKLFDLKPEEQIYDLYVPLHNLWKDCMKDLVDAENISEKNMSETLRRISRSDMHGAIIGVKRSKNPSLVGIQGIVVMETKNTFKVITKENKLKTLPKPGSIFSMQLGGHLVTIYGNNFCYKSSERSTRSFKAKYNIDL